MLRDATHCRTSLVARTSLNIFGLHLLRGSGIWTGDLLGALSQDFSGQPVVAMAAALSIISTLTISAELVAILTASS